MATTSIHPRDIFDLMGKVIGYVHIVLFSIVMTCYSQFTFSDSRYHVNSPFFVRLAVLGLVVIMFALSFLLAIGISMRNPNYVLPWLIMTVFTVIADTVYLSVNHDDTVTVFGYVIMFFLVISWYPISILYQRYDEENETSERQCQQQQPITDEENYPLERPVIVTNGPPNYYEVKGEDPPSYSVAMGICSDVTAADCKSDLQAETCNKE